MTPVHDIHGDIGMHNDHLPIIPDLGTPVLPGPVVTPGVTPIVLSERSTWEAIKGTVVDGANWCGRSVCWIGSKISDIAVACWEFVEPIFSKIGTFFTTQARNTRDFVVEHKSEVLIAAVSFCVGILVCSVINSLCCNKKPATP